MNVPSNGTRAQEGELEVEETHSNLAGSPSARFPVNPSIKSVGREIASSNTRAGPWGGRGRCGEAGGAGSQGHSGGGRGGEDTRGSGDCVLLPICTPPLRWPMSDSFLHEGSFMRRELHQEALTSRVEICTCRQRQTAVGVGGCGGTLAGGPETTDLGATQRTLRFQVATQWCGPAWR